MLMNDSFGPVVYERLCRHSPAVPFFAAHLPAVVVVEKLLVFHDQPLHNVNLHCFSPRGNPGLRGIVLCHP